MRKSYVTITLDNTLIKYYAENNKYLCVYKLS